MKPVTIFLVGGAYHGTHGEGSSGIKTFANEEDVIAALLAKKDTNNGDFRPERILKVTTRGYDHTVDVMALVVDGFTVKLKAVPEVTQR